MAKNLWGELETNGGNLLEAVTETGITECCRNATKRLKWRHIAKHLSELGGNDDKTNKIHRLDHDHYEESMVTAKVFVCVVSLWVGSVSVKYLCVCMIALIFICICRNEIDFMISGESRYIIILNLLDSHM